jgi:hypothetical protein
LFRDFASGQGERLRDYWPAAGLIFSTGFKSR